jgi:hypothetical protein
MNLLKTRKNSSFIENILIMIVGVIGFFIPDMLDEAKAFSLLFKILGSIIIALCIIDFFLALYLRKKKKELKEKMGELDDRKVLDMINKSIGVDDDQASKSYEEDLSSE